MARIITWILACLILIGAVLMLGNLMNGVPKDKAISIGYFSAAVYTLLFGFLLRNIIQRLIFNFNKRLVFTILGAIGAIFIETVIWWAQTNLHTTGAAISPNLWVDLIMTLPFYILLSYFLSGQVFKYEFSWPTIAVVAGFYEVAADGVIGNLFILNIIGAFISPIMLPIFIVVYSPIILVPFLLLSRSPFSFISFPDKQCLLLFLSPLKAVLILPFSLAAGFFLSQVLK